MMTERTTKVIALNDMIKRGITPNVGMLYLSRVLKTANAKIHTRLAIGVSHLFACISTRTGYLGRCSYWCSNVFACNPSCLCNQLVFDPLKRRFMLRLTEARKTTVFLSRSLETK